MTKLIKCFGTKLKGPFTYLGSFIAIHWYQSYSLEFIVQWQYIILITSFPSVSRDNDTALPFPEVLVT